MKAPAKIVPTTLRRILTAAIVLVTLTPVQAHAYIDPGAGSVLFQIALAAFVGGLFFVKSFFRKMAAFFKKRGGSGN